MVRPRHIIFYLALFCLSLVWETEACATSGKAEKFELGLPEYKSYLFQEGQNRTSWHMMNEARHLLVTGGMIAAGYGLHRLNATGLPVYTMASIAGLATDFSLSQNWQDFAYRQLVRAPLTAWRWYYQKGSYPWIDPLLQEIPQLLAGANEVWTQTQNNLPEGSSKIHLEEEQKSIEIFFSNIQHPHFLIRFTDQTPLHCGKINTKNNDYGSLLNSLACSADQHQIQSIIVQPIRNASGSKRSLVVRSQRRNKDIDSQVIPVIPSHIKGDKQRKTKLWITENLSKTPKPCLRLK